MTVNTAICNESNPRHTQGEEVSLSVNTSGELRVIIPFLEPNVSSINYYVDASSTGTGIPDGSSIRPFRTLTEAC